MKEDPPITDEFYLQADKEIKEGTVDEYCWSLAKDAGINEVDIEIHYMNLRIGQLKHEENAKSFWKKLVTKVKNKWEYRKRGNS